MSDFDHAYCEIQRPRQLTIVTPAREPRRTRLMTAFSDWLHAWRRRREFKSLATRLLTYDDHQLDDMGYSRRDLLAAMDLPLKLDARRQLARWSERRLKSEPTYDSAAATRRRSNHEAFQNHALLNGINLGIVGPTGRGPHGRSGR